MSTDQASTSVLSTDRAIGWVDRGLSCLIAVIASLYLSLFWIQKQPWMPGWLTTAGREFRFWMIGRMSGAIEAVIGWSPAGPWRWAALSLVMGLVVPWLFMLVLGRGRPGDIGLKWPNRVGWRLAIVGYVVSLPFLIAATRSPAMQAYYSRQLSSWSLGALLGAYVVVLLAEHFLFHGVLLALLHPRRRWPVVSAPAEVEGIGPRRALRWLGLSQPVGGGGVVSRATRWIGLPEGCLWAMALQTVVFGLIHVGKAPAEVALSFPGGLAMAYVAYRSDSLLTPMVIHTTTGITTLGLVWLTVS